MHLKKFCPWAALAIFGCVPVMPGETEIRMANEPDEPLSAVDIRQMGADSTPPVVVSQSNPNYPFSMRRAALNGEVLVGFIVDTKGVVREAQVIRSNNPWFERPALDAVLQWRFQPARINGRAVNTRMAVPIKFQIEGGGDDLFTVNRSNLDRVPPEFRWDQPPVPISTAYPVYPFAKLQTKQKAVIRVVFIVDVDGRVQVVDRPDTAAQPKEFTQAVRAMLDLWRFKPAKKGNQSCPAIMTAEYEFSPNNAESVPINDAARDILRELKSQEPRIYSLKELDRMPTPLSRRPPAYPSSLREENIEGQAVVEFFIDKKGDAQLPRIVSSTREDFGYAAVQAVATWRFQPPTKNKQPVFVRVQIPIEFHLNAKESPAKQP